MLFGWSLGWVFLTVSIWLRRAEVVFSLAGIVVLPLMFVSSAWVPVDELPTVLAWIARANPVTYAVNADRVLLLSTATGSAAAETILYPIVFSLILGLVGAYCGIRLFRRPLQSLRW
jgi:ABC-2 type transport system permease protein